MLSRLSVKFKAIANECVIIVVVINMFNLYNYTQTELAETLVERGFKSFNAKQIFEWLYKKGESDHHNMTNLPKGLRAHLDQTRVTPRLRLHTRQASSDGTVKFLFRLDDGYLIETVLMRHGYGKSVCVTTQVGCNIGCSFCASGLKKKTRDLSAAEMVLQVLYVASSENIRVSHVVLMGTGEPFDNYDNSMRFIDIINDHNGLEIGARHITVSTSGIVPRIDDFAQRNTQVNLAISLHAHTNALRTKLMPINKSYPLEQLIESVRRYVETTNRRVTFEYLLLGGVNDSKDDADKLSDLLRGLNAYVNLIPYNPVSEFDYRPSTLSKQRAFFDRLKKRGIQATLREEKGGDIDAACGQLRTKEDA